MPYLRVVQSGKTLEAYEYEKSTEFFNDTPRKSRKARAVSHDSVDTQASPRRYDNLKRLKRDFRRLILSNIDGTDKSALLTLTMFEVLGVKRSHQFFRVFILRLRKALKRDFRFISVVEFQKRGAVHFHVLIWGIPSLVIEHERYGRGIQGLWQRGFVDCIATDGSERLAGYLAKYLSKAMQDKRLLGERSYSVSRNILRPVLHKSTEEFDDVSEYFLGAVDNSPRQDIRFQTQWFGRGRYRLYKLN